MKLITNFLRPLAKLVKKIEIQNKVRKKADEPFLNSDRPENHCYGKGLIEGAELVFKELESK